jgi:ribonuclease HI
MRNYWKLPDEKCFRYTGNDWLQVLLGSVDENTRAKILLLLWRSWHLRNDCIHNDGKETIERSASFLQAYIGEELQNTSGLENIKGKSPMFHSDQTIQLVPERNISWSPPPKGWIKVNTDASFIGENHPGGTGAVVRDSDGKVLLAACSPVPGCRDAEDAESKGAWLGLKLLDGLGHDKVILELDCANAVKALSSREPDRSILWHTYDQTKELLKGFSSYRVIHVRRESNRVADKLAMIARSAGSCIWSDKLPDVIQDYVNQDTIVTGPVMI